MDALRDRDNFSKSGRFEDEEAEKDSGNVTQSYLEGDSRDLAIRRIKTAETISMSPELFERLYLTPHTAAKGDLRLTWGNPSPLALVGLVVGLTPLACDLMGWRGAGGAGAASIGAFYFIGGLLLIVSGILDFFLRNTFPFVVFTSYGGFFLAYAATLQPFYNAAGAYSSTGNNAIEGEASPAYAASFGFFLLFMAVLSFIFFICSVRTNICLLLIFTGGFIGFALLTGSFWNLAKGNLISAAKLQTGGGGCFFVSSMVGLYLLLAQMLESVDFPLRIPLGDLSLLVKGAAAREKARETV